MVVEISQYCYQKHSYQESVIKQLESVLEAWKSIHHDAPVDLLKRNQSCDIISFLSSVLVQKPLTTSMNKKADHHKKKQI